MKYEATAGYRNKISLTTLLKIINHMFSHCFPFYAKLIMLAIKGNKHEILPLKSNNEFEN